MTTDRLIRLREVMNKCGLCRSAVFALSKEGKFPASINLAGTRAVGWSERAVNEWIEQQIETSGLTPIAAEWLPTPASRDFEPLPCAAFLADIAPQGIEATRWPAPTPTPATSDWVTGPAAVSAVSDGAAQ
jgi:prophage regulatory protein